MTQEAVPRDEVGRNDAQSDESPEGQAMPSWMAVDADRFEKLREEADRLRANWRPAQIILRSQWRSA